VTGCFVSIHKTIKYGLVKVESPWNEKIAQLNSVICSAFLSVVS